MSENYFSTCDSSHTRATDAPQLSAEHAPSKGEIGPNRHLDPSPFGLRGTEKGARDCFSKPILQVQINQRTARHNFTGEPWLYTDTCVTPSWGGYLMSDISPCEPYARHVLIRFATVGVLHQNLGGIILASASFVVCLGRNSDCEYRLLSFVLRLFAELH